MPTNADQRRRLPTASRDLQRTVRYALPLLVRRQVVDAVLRAQTLALEPVTSAQARAAQPILTCSRAFTEVARVIAQLGPDERGRRLRDAGVDRKGFARWWVEESE